MDDVRERVPVLSQQSPVVAPDESTSSKPNNRRKIAFFVSLGLTILVIGLSIVFVSTAWTDYGDAKKNVSATESQLADAQSTLNVANGYYDEALADYVNWYSCYVTTSWLYSWVCGSSSLVSSNLDYASSVVDTAESDVVQARSRLKTAKNALDQSADAFNTSTWTWGAVSAGSLVAFAVAGFLFAKEARLKRRADELDARPDWACPECSAQNDGGMFCVSCGFPKAEATASRPVDSAHTAKNGVS